jgi:hypothetical protein
MGVWLRIDYPHSTDLRPRYLTNAQIEDLAWRVRLQLGYASSSTPKIPLDLLLSIDGAIVNGLQISFCWEIENAICDEHGIPVLGICDYDPDEMPDTIWLSANAGMVRRIEEMLRSILAHELGHGLCDAPSWVVTHRNLAMSGAGLVTPSLNPMRSVTPDEAHLFSARPTRRDFAEFRAGAFMGAFLVPRPLIFARLCHHAQVLGVPLIEAPMQWSTPAVPVPGLRIAPQFGGNFWLRPLFGALASDFGISPRFIEVRLMRYGALADEKVGPSRVARYR